MLGVRPRAANIRPKRVVAGPMNMEFRRGNQRDERRRRVLMEKPGWTEDAEGAEPPGSPPESSRRYTDAARSVRRCRVSDLIPVRWWAGLLWFLLLVSSAAGLEAAYGYLAWSHTPFRVWQLPAFDLAQRGNVATWFSSMLLALCAVYGLLIYQIRRYRVDDYRGRYRLWRWMVPAFLLLSVDQVAGVQGSLYTVVRHVTSVSEQAHGPLLRHGSTAVLAALLTGRLVVEMHASRLASLLLTAALVCFGVVSAARVGWLLNEPTVLHTIILSSLLMGAQMLLLMSLLVYARHVHRDAHAEPVVRHRKRRKRRQPRVASEEPSESEPQGRSPSKSRTARTRTRDGKIIRTDPAHTSGKKSTSKKSSSAQSTGQSSRSGRQKAAAADSGQEAASRQTKRRRTASKTSAAQSTPAEASELDDQADEKPSRQMSKSERKRLRKERRRQQREAS